MIHRRAPLLKTFSHGSDLTCFPSIKPRRNFIPYIFVYEVIKIVREGGQNYTRKYSYLLYAKVFPPSPPSLLHKKLVWIVYSLYLYSTSSNMIRIRWLYNNQPLHETGEIEQNAKFTYCTVHLYYCTQVPYSLQHTIVRCLFRSWVHQYVLEYRLKKLKNWLCTVIIYNIKNIKNVKRPYRTLYRHSIYNKH